VPGSRRTPTTTTKAIKKPLENKQKKYTAAATVPGPLPSSVGDTPSNAPAHFSFRRWHAYNTTHRGRETRGTTAVPPAFVLSSPFIGRGCGRKGSHWPFGAPGRCGCGQCSGGEVRLRRPALSLLVHGGPLPHHDGRPSWSCGVGSTHHVSARPHLRHSHPHPHLVLHSHRLLHSH